MKQYRSIFGLLGASVLASCNLLTAAPQVSITNPGTITGTSLTIEAVPSGNTNAIEVLLNGTSLGKKTSSPYTWTTTVNRANNGNNTISGFATNASGGFAYAQPQTFMVNLAPKIGLTSSSPSITNATPITLTAAPEDASAGLAKVEFYQGANLIGTDLSAPFTQSVSFTQAVQNGLYNYSAKSFDAAGNTATSSLVPITVAIADTTMPTVALTAVGSVTGVALAATATDDVGVTKVEFYSGTTLLNTDTTAPYSFDLSLMAAGNLFPNYTAKAFDATGNSTVSNAIQDVWESNNTSATALMLDTMPVRTQAGVTLGGSLDGTTPDVDYYAVNLTFAQVLKVRTYSSGGTDTVVRIFNAAGVQLAFNDASGDYNNTDSAVNWRASDNGVYYIAVSAYTNGVTPAIQDASKQYRMTVQVGD
jgi:hypothetical protein